MIAEQNGIVLPDTTLCAIVRDEIVNPAGGIVDFIDSTVPFVEEAVVIDTGSVDGTKDALEDAKPRYPNLRVYHEKFLGYAASRNSSLERVQTKRALVLDADERLTRRDFQVLSTQIDEAPAVVYVFKFINVYVDREEEGGGHTKRLFDIGEGIMFYELKEVWELLRTPKSARMISTGIDIKHFRVSPELKEEKLEQWYRTALREAEKPHLAVPSKCPSFAEWKAPNPRRELYR